MTLDRSLLPALILLLHLPLHAAEAAGQSLPTASPEEVGMSAERLLRVNQRIQEYIDDGLIAGAVTLIARDGRVVHHEAHGFRDRESGARMREDDIFVIMSMTKPIVSTALMMLHEEGRFLLSDPISNWLPEFEGMQVRAAGGDLVPAQPITMRHVLTHSTGFGGGLAAPVVRPGSPTRPGDSPLRARVRLIAEEPLGHQPGARWTYGNSTDVVAALVEELSGQNMDDFLRERIFQPLGMNDTHYNVPREKWNRRARLYEPQAENGNRIEARPVTEPNPTNVFGGVAGLSSTAADYFRFAQMVMNGGEYQGARILGPKTVNTMITNHLDEGLGVSLKGPGYGFGLGYSVLLDVGKASESLSPGSYGWGGAWGTYYFNDPAEDLIGIIMMQLSSYRHLNIRGDLGTLATQAILEPKTSGSQRIRGYDRLE
jgi:CubicO group peptidase (beta-lactamase class C family)